MNTDPAPVGERDSPYTHPGHMPGATRQTTLNVESTCPICGADSIYLFNPDRYFHLDGSANRRCWVGMTRGEGNTRCEPAVRITRTTRRTRPTSTGDPQ